MKKVNEILAAGIIASVDNLAKNLAVIIGANPAIAELLVDPTEPALTDEECVDYIKRNWSSRPKPNLKIRKKSIQLQRDLEWTVSVEIEYDGFFDSQVHADNHSTHYSSSEQKDNYQIPGKVYDTMSWRIC